VVPITNVLRLWSWPERAHFAGVSRTMASAAGLCEQLCLDSDSQANRRVVSPPKPSRR